MFQKTKSKDTKEFSLSNEDVGTLEALVGGRQLTEMEYQFKMQGYNSSIENHMQTVEKKLGINLDTHVVDWQTALKDRKIYVTPKPEEEPTVTTGEEEVNPNVNKSERTEDNNKGKGSKQEKRKKTGKSKG